MTELAAVGTPDHPARTVRFGVFELDLGSGELRRDGIRVKLQDQPFRLLVFLLERPGQVVTREQLRQHLWPADFVDFDHSLNTAVRKLRSALDDTAENPRFIETLARRGYRFIAPVQTDAVPEEAPPADHRRMRIGGAALLLIAILVAAFAGYRSRIPPAPPVNAIAVLPFTNADTSTQHVSDGLTEILIDTISRVPDLKVMARTTTFRYKGSNDPRWAGRELNVGAVVTGNVQRESSGYRIHVELIDVKDGTQLWGRQYRATSMSLAETQSRISGDLTQQLRGALAGDRRTLVTRSLTGNAEAYELYLRGLYAWNQRGEKDLRASIDLFNRAAAADPTFGAPHAGIANAYGVMVGYGLLPPDTGAPLVMAAARKALQLDPNNAEAYVSLASTEYRNLWDFAAAERHYKKGLALNPNYATGHQWYSDLLRSLGRFEEARREIDLAYSLDPLSFPITASKCWSLYNDRQYEKALEFARKAGQIDPRFSVPFCTARVLLALGRYEEANKLTFTGATEQLHDHFMEAYRAHGARGIYETRLKILLETTSPSLSVPVEIAASYAMLGRRDEAFTWLENAYAHRISRVTNINVDPEFDPLRGDPRFDDLLRRIGLPKLQLPGPLLKPIA